MFASSHIIHTHSQRLECWSLELRAYECDVVYRSGKTKQNADTLSRKPITLVALNPSMETQDSVLSSMFQQLQRATPPPTTEDPNPFKALQAALVPTVFAQCHHMLQGALTHDAGSKAPSCCAQVIADGLPGDCSQCVWASEHYQNSSLIVAYWAGQGQDVIGHC